MNLLKLDVDSMEQTYLVNPSQKKTKVRDAWSPLHTPGVAQQPVETALVSYAQDMWTDADIEPIFGWLEDHLKERRSNARRMDISNVA